MKTWSIFPVDDGLEENHETFTVLLKHPRNAVLGQWTSARVEISDPRGGENSALIGSSGSKTLSDGRSQKLHVCCQDAVTRTT